MDVEILDLCIGSVENVQRVKIYKKGSRAVIYDKKDLYFFRNLIDTFISEDRNISSDNYNEKMLHILERPETKYTSTTFIDVVKDPDYFDDQRILIEKKIRAYENPAKFNYGTIFDDDGVLAFRGETKDGKAQGYGKMLYPTGVTEYEGHFANNEMDGTGELFSETQDLIYRGHFRDSQRHGLGIEFYYTGGKMYQGNFKQDQRHGNGVLYSILGDVIFRGVFTKGEPHKKQANTIGRKDAVTYYEQRSKQELHADVELSPPRQKQGNKTDTGSTKIPLDDEQQYDNEPTIPDSPDLTDKIRRQPQIVQYDEDLNLDSPSKRIMNDHIEDLLVCNTIDSPTPQRELYDTRGGP